jgi:hypothetical protein
MVDTHDVTTFNSSGWKESTAGLKSWTAGIDGFYDNSSVGSSFALQLAALLGATGGILSVYENKAAALGDYGFLGSDAILDKESEPISVADIVKLSGQLKGNGRAGLVGRVLHAYASATAAGNGTELDSWNGVSSTAGGRANLHVTEFTCSGVVTLKVQHSNDATNWVDYLTFTTISTGVMAETLESTAKVERYLRENRAVTSATGLNMKYVLGFARY